MACLVVWNRRYPIHDDSHKIVGRELYNEIALEDASVSRYQATIRISTGTNGAFANGDRVDSAQLFTGEHLRSFRVKYRGERQCD